MGVDIEKKKEKSSGIFMSAMNITNTIIGSGIITLPMSLQWGGVTLSLILTVIVGILTDYSIVCLGRIVDLTSGETYQELMYKALGKPGYIILILCQSIYPIFSILSYGIIMASNLKDIFIFLLPKVTVLQNNYLVLSIPIFLAIFPLSSFKNISFLDKASLVSVILVCYYIIVILSQIAFYPQRIFMFEGAMNPVQKGFMQTISFLSFSFACQQSIPSIYNSMSQKNFKRFSVATHLSCGFTFIFYAIIGMVGFMTFGGKVNNSNIIQAYCPDNIAMTSARIAFVITLILTAPCQIFACREAIITPIYKKYGFKWWVHISITFCICSIMFLISANVYDLGTVVAISGSLIGAPLSFILPALGFLRGLRQGWLPNTPSKVGSYIVIIFGICSCIIGTVMALIFSGKNHEVKYWCNSCINEYTQPMTPTSTALDSLKSIWSS